MTMISALLFGYSRYNAYKSRPKELNMFISLISAYKLELQWRKKTLSELIDGGLHLGYPEYIDDARRLLAVKSPREAFIECNPHYSKLHLNADDTAVLGYFFEESGKCGLMQEIALCDKTLVVLKARMDDADAERKRLAPLALKLAVLCGIWMIILIV